MGQGEQKGHTGHSCEEITQKAEQWVNEIKTLGLKERCGGETKREAGEREKTDESETNQSYCSDSSD